MIELKEWKNNTWEHIGCFDDCFIIDDDETIDTPEDNSYCDISMEIDPLRIDFDFFIIFTNQFYAANRFLIPLYHNFFSIPIYKHNSIYNRKDFFHKSFMSIIHQDKDISEILFSAWKILKAMDKNEGAENDPGQVVDHISNVVNRSNARDNKTIFLLAFDDRVDNENQFVIPICNYIDEYTDLLKKKYGIFLIKQIYEKQDEQNLIKGEQISQQSLMVHIT